jgi:hypothetical protein
VVTELLALCWSPWADQPPAAAATPRRASDESVPREHLPGRLPAGIAADASVTAGAAPKVTGAGSLLAISHMTDDLDRSRSTTLGCHLQMAVRVRVCQ